MPSSLVVVDCVRPPWRVAVTVTPGTAAPFTSTTVPSNEPVVVDCADAPTAKSERTRASTVMILNGVLMLSIPFFESAKCLWLRHL